MTVFVITDSRVGSIDRYVAGGNSVERTHGAVFGQPVTFTEKFVREFRNWPDPEYAVDPPPRPTGPPIGFGTARAA